MSEKTTPRPGGSNQVAPTPPAFQPGPKGGYGLSPKPETLNPAKKQLFEVAYTPEKEAVIDIELRHGLPLNATCCCCFGGEWDEAYEFSAPVSNAWFNRAIRAMGFFKPQYAGTMFDIVDELQRCQHISKIQLQNIYALVRTAMGYQYRAEKNIAKHRAGVFIGAMCAILVPVLGGLLTPTDAQSFYAYGVVALSLIQSTCLGIVIFANYVSKAELMRVHAANIKSEIYQYEALGGQYANPPDYQTQYPRLMHNLSEFRYQTAISEIAGRVKDRKDGTL